MVVIEKIIVDKLPQGCVYCQLHQNEMCYGLVRDDYDADTECNIDYRRSDCPMEEKSGE